MIKKFAINGRGGDTEGTRASGIAEEIVEGFVIEAKRSMNTDDVVYDRLFWMEPLTLVRIWPCEVDARVD